MQLKVVSTLVFASLAAALALPQPPSYKGSVAPPPKDPLPPPTSTHLPPPPKTDALPAASPVSHLDVANSQKSGQEKTKSDNLHVSRDDRDLKKDLPPKDLPLPTTYPTPPPLPKTVPPPPKTDTPPPKTDTPPPKTDTPAATSVPHLDVDAHLQDKANDLKI